MIRRCRLVQAQVQGTIVLCIARRVLINERNCVKTARVCRRNVGFERIGMKVDVHSFRPR